MKKRKEEEPERINAREMMSDLCSAKFALTHFQQESRLYNGIVTELLKVDDDTPIPSSKELQKRLQLSPSQLSKQLQQLYDDFWTALQGPPLLIQPQKVVHACSVRGYGGKWAYFTCKLPVTPRVGERMTFPFLRGKTGTTYYHVSSVEYNYENDTLFINLTLRAGSFNSYFAISKDRLELERKVGLRDFLSMPDYKIEELIREHYSN